MIFLVLIIVLPMKILIDFTIDELNQCSNDTSSINNHLETNSFNSTNMSLITIQTIQLMIQTMILMT